MKSSNYGVVISGKNDTKDAFKQINNDLKRTNTNISTLFDTGTRKGRNFRQNIQQVGFQVQDFAVQVGGGTNALQAFGQQGSQLAGIFGPTGAIIGAIIAIGSVIGVSLAPALLKSKDAVKDLTDVMERLDSVARKGDNGILQFTDSLKELSTVGVSALGAELEASLIRAEQAASSAATAIIEKLNDLDVGPVTFGIERYLEGLEETSKSTKAAPALIKAYSETAQDLGEQLGKTGEDARELGRSILLSLSSLKTKPTADGFKALQDTLSGLVLESDKVSDKTKLLISDLNIFFAESRSAAESAAFFKEQLAALSNGGGLEQLEESTSKSNDYLVSLNQQLIIASLELANNKDEADKLAFAFNNGFTSFAQMPETARALYNQLKLVTLEQQKLTDLQQAQSQSQKTLESLTKAFTPNTLEDQNAARIEAIENLALSEEQIKAAGYETLLDLQRDYIAQSNSLLEQQLFDQTESDYAYFERKLEASTAFAQRKAEIEEINRQREQAAAGNAFLANLVALEQYNSKYAGIARAAAIAQATIRTYESATSSYAALASIPIVGPALGAAAAAAAIAAGLANVAAIRATPIAGARELGGPVSGGKTYLVGEKGPELFTAGATGQITSNDNLNRAIGDKRSASQSITINLSPMGGGDQGYWNGQAKMIQKAINREALR